MSSLNTNHDSPSTLAVALRLGQGDLARGIETLAGLLEAADRQRRHSGIQAHGGALRPVVRSIESGSVHTEVTR
jgi:hypothetical protein